MSENNTEVKNENSVDSSPKETNEESASKRRRKTGKRLSTLTRTTQEGEAILKGMGHKEDGTPEGRRTTRSSTRGSIANPPPAKREKKTPTPKGRGRGRGKKDEEEEVVGSTKEEKKEGEEEERGAEEAMETDGANGEEHPASEQTPTASGDSTSAKQEDLDKAKDTEPTAIQEEKDGSYIHVKKREKTEVESTKSYYEDDEVKVVEEEELKKDEGDDDPPADSAQ